MAEQALISCSHNAKNAGKLILHGNLVAALESLSQTGEGGRLLEAKLDSILERLGSLEQYNRKKESEYYKQLKDLEYENDRLRGRKSTLERSIASKEVSISDIQRELSNARDEMNSARHRRNQAQREYDKFRTFWWVPIWGQILVVKELIEDNESIANNAQQRMDRYDREISSLNSDLVIFRNDLASLNRSIQSVLSSLNSCNQKINEIHSNISNITSATAEVLDAKVYWKNSVFETRAINDKTAHMQRLVEGGKGNPSKFSSSKPTERVVNNYESSWGRVENVLSEAFFNKISITFTCTLCNITKTSLPYINSSDNFVCEDCH